MFSFEVADPTELAKLRAHKVVPCYARQLPGALPQRSVSLLRAIRYPGSLHAAAHTATPAPARLRHAMPGNSRGWMFGGVDVFKKAEET